MNHSLLHGSTINLSFIPTETFSVVDQGRHVCYHLQGEGSVELSHHDHQQSNLFRHHSFVRCASSLASNVMAPIVSNRGFTLLISTPRAMPLYADTIHTSLHIATKGAF